MRSVLKTFLKSLLSLLAAKIGPHTVPLSQPRLWILMYHRVLPGSDSRAAAEEPGMIVSPETFDMHLRVLKENFTLLSLNQWLYMKRNGEHLPKRACVITFDDGWLDNYEYAFPIIKKHKVPVTLFAVEGMIGTTLNFWPNRVANLLASSELRAQKDTSLSWMGQEALSCLNTELPFQEQVAQVIDHLKNFEDHYLLQHIDKSEMALNSHKTAKPCMMNWEQLREMQGSGLVDIGCHTHSHIRLHQNLSTAQLHKELVQSKQVIEETISSPVTLFCYPNGDYNQPAHDLVKQTYSAAVSTKRGINTVDQDPTQLLRIGVHEDISNTETKFKSRLSGWL